MKVEQRVEIRGDDVVVKLLNHTTREQSERVYVGAGKYAAYEGKEVVVRFPARVGLDFKRS